MISLANVVRLKMPERILICTDLDRTLLPNGAQAESPGARDRFGLLARQPQVDVAYVTGRHRALVLEAIQEYEIPFPDYVIADVGSSIYHCEQEHWQLWKSWQEEIAADWNGYQHDDLKRFLRHFNELVLQETEKQNTHKLSYYAPEDTDVEPLLASMQRHLQQYDIRANLIWSIDDLKHTGLLDVLPKKASKLHAIEFLMQQQDYSHKNTVFAGDSGNDMAVLSSHLQSILVANARDDVRLQAQAMVEKKDIPDSLYIARGALPGMNGNYAAGILEGINHYMPELFKTVSA